ncbi:low molecular weight protein-tyrosine-phosphatase [Marinomonas shanghaiensis]|jgi:protein-tyrosine-phosphatase|uniref:low molecular weight protein-tyrosine-phosphatase n=1 Tax=Marinomonas shanghaiensis TaxID=2202418 RepID=UPI000DB8FF7F|nr:low molecular weight protein-tyrosine-phosphatase [Marinomonas shanghaiensis]
MKSQKVLMVCLGNICRSPAAQGIIESLNLKQGGVRLEVDSAGTAAYHVGNPPDSRSIAVLKQVGIHIDQQQARQVTKADFAEFDWILAMDRENLANLKKIQPAACKAKVVLFGEFEPSVSFGEVADPYYGGEDGFVAMRKHLTQISEAFIHYLYLRKED